MHETIKAYRTVLPLLTPSPHADPYPTYRRLRAQGPLLLRPFGMWVISSYEHANLLVRHPAVSSANRNKLFEAFFRGEAEDIRKTILFSDPPDHTRLRSLVSKAFTPRRIEQLTAYLLDRIRERRAAPGDDLLSALIAAEEDGSQLDEGELVAMTGLLLVGGFETVANLTANGLLALLRHPDQLDRLRRDPTLGESAVEELLRYDTPVQMVVRTTLADISVGPTVIRKGQLMLIVLGAANRDPAQFRDTDRLDLGRAPNAHLTLIAGHHFCLGAHLARIELQVAFSTLLRRLPDLHLDAPRLGWRHTIALRGLRSLPLSYAPAA